MAFVCEEIGRGGNLNGNPAISRAYFAHDYADESTAGAAVLSYLVSNPPSGMGALVVKDVDPRETEIPNVYRVSVTWGPYERKQPTATGGNDFSFEFRTEQTNVTTALQTTAHDVPGEGTAPDSGTAMFVDPATCQPRGKPIEEPVYAWCETHYFTLAQMTAAYKQAISKVVNKTNVAPFRGYPAGEVLCGPVSGQQRGADDFAVTFKFEQKENRNVTVAGVTFQKKGWEEVEVRYERRDDSTSHRMIAVPVGVYVHRLKESANFGTLNIGA